MKISATMVKYYLSYLTVGWFGDHDAPPEEGAEIASIARNIQILANGAGDLVWLRTGLEALLTDPQAPLMEFDGGQYPFSRAGLLEVLKMLWEQLAPGTPLDAPGEGPRVEWVDMTAAEWTAFKQRLAED